MGVAMKTRLMTSGHARRIATSLVFVAALLVSGATFGSATGGEPIDAATQAAWLAEHLDCEYGTEMTDGQPIDAATQAAWLAEHLDCEYGTEMTEASRSTPPRRPPGSRSTSTASTAPR